MAYIVVTESDSTTGETTCKIKGLTTPTITHLENYFSGLNISYDNHREYFEVDVQGVLILNVLSGQGYRVLSQSMAIEYNTIGGRSIKIQKIVWTLGKNV